MRNKMSMTLNLNQRMVMNVQLKQAITLLQYNSLELRQLVKQCIEQNPLLEVENELLNEDEDNSVDSALNEDYVPIHHQTAALSRSNIHYDGDNVFENYVEPKNLRQHLFEQTMLCQFTAVEQTIAEAIIDAIDDRGYLTMSLEEIRNTLSLSPLPEINAFMKVLKKIHTFDPIGIGAASLKECLLLQLESTVPKSPAVMLAAQIITDHFDTTLLSHVNKIAKQLKVSHQEMMSAIDIIRGLDPYPGERYSNQSNTNIEPEIVVKKTKNGWEVFLSASIVTQLQLNKQYSNLIKQSKHHTSYAALKKELDEAKWLLNGLKKRNETLLSVSTYIVKSQVDFFEYGASHMRQMNIAEVANALDIHESTVSRITTGKYMATPRGVFELKYFFPSGVVTQDGHSCSATAVQAYIKDMIANEVNGHIHSDAEITAKLRQKGINIARRTVAKYREAMQILPSYLRHGQFEEV